MNKSVIFEEKTKNHEKHNNEQRNDIDLFE